MKFCIIAPVAGLEKYATLSKNHLVLAHLLHSEPYNKFYNTRRTAGDHIILDNGAYENTKPLDGPAYFNMIRRLSPNVVVLPDKLMSPWRETTSLSLNFLDQFATQLEAMHHRIEWMFVPQTEKSSDSHDDFTSREAFKRALDVVVNDGRVGKYVKWIGLGRYLHTEFINMPGKKFRRAGLCREIKSTPGFGHLKIHALGMANANLDEMKALADEGCDAIDSSAPVWRGWNGYALNSHEWDVKGTPCNFFDKPWEEEMFSQRHQLILSNLEACGVDTTSAR